MSVHRKLKRGRPLEEHPVELIFPYDPLLQIMDEELRAAGYARSDSVQPRVRQDGRISVKVVWRNQVGDSVTRCARFDIVGA